ncbi:MAG: ABC transporter ATP-binding protein [Oscillospiraceae bacterium]|jgi:ABC-2 type transport system ATP-binding protein|nr:ABC transporter ATP-binding protein [Oscillospiraceae bacterium]
MEQPAILVEDVSMMFHMNNEKIDNLKEYVIRVLKRKMQYTEFWALRNVSFAVQPGERLGVLGFNGAGKSTLLKIIAGVMKPTKGKVEIRGVVAPLLELGAGFDMNYSGRENIFLYGATMGFSRSYVRQRYDEIIAFSELKDFIDAPVKNYSSGMRARLGFSIATAVEPEVLIVDEVLSVGDAKFKAKSEAKIKGMFDQGVTVLFVSHNTAQVRSLCNKAILLEKGGILAQGEVNQVCDIYDGMVKRK